MQGHALRAADLPSSGFEKHSAINPLRKPQCPLAHRPDPYEPRSAHKGLRRPPHPRGKGQEIYHAGAQALRRPRDLRRGDGRPARPRGRLLAADQADPGRRLTRHRSVLSTHTSKTMAELIAARPWLTVFRLPPYAHELNPV